MLKIWGRNTSSNVQKVIWALAEMKLPFERIDVGGAFGKTKDPFYLAMNPNSLVPTLEEEDGFTMWESNSIVRYLAGHRTAWLTATMRDLTWLGSTVFLVPLVVVIGLAVRHRTKSWGTMARLALSLGGAIALYDIIKPLVGRPRPHVGQLVSTATGYSFPSGHATQTAAVAVTLAALGAALTSSWPGKVTIWSAAALVCLVVGGEVEGLAGEKHLAADLAIGEPAATPPVAELDEPAALDTRSEDDHHFGELRVVIADVGPCRLAGGHDCACCR